MSYAFEIAGDFTTSSICYLTKESYKRNVNWVPTIDNAVSVNST